jgi:hypothetical protein
MLTRCRDRAAGDRKHPGGWGTSLGWQTESCRCEQDRRACSPQADASEAAPPGRKGRYRLASVRHRLEKGGRLGVSGKCCGSPGGPR